MLNEPLLYDDDDDSVVAETANPMCLRVGNITLNVVLGIAPFCNAIYDGAVMIQGASDTATDYKFSENLRIVAMSAIGSMAFLQSLLLNTETTVTEIKETAVLVQTRAPSHHWPELQPWAFYSMLGLTLLLGADAAICDFFGGAYFVGDMQDEYADSILEVIIPAFMWAYLASSTGAVAAITTLFTEGIGIFKEVGKLVNHTGGRYSGTFSKYFCRIIGWPIIALAAMEVVCEAHAAIRNLTKPENTLNKYGTFLIATPKAVGDLCFSGQLALSGMDKFIDILSDPDKRKRIQPIQTAAFVLSVVSAVVVESIQPALTWQLLTEEDDRPPFYMPDSIIDALAFGVTVRDGIVQVQSYYPLVLFLLTIGNVVGGKASHVIQALLKLLGCSFENNNSVALPDVEFDDFYYAALETNNNNPYGNKQTSLPPKRINYLDDEYEEKIVVRPKKLTAPAQNGIFHHTSLQSSRSLPAPAQAAAILKNGYKS